MNLRRAVILLTAGALLLPIVTIVLIGVARLLAAMQDLGGAAVIDRLALAIAVVWLIDLVLLLVIQAVHSLGPPE